MKKRPAGILFLAFLFLYLLTMGGHIYSPDEEILFLTTKALAEEGSLSIEPPEALREGPRNWFATKEGLDGKQYGQYGVGQPLLAIPFFMFGRTLSQWIGDRPIGLPVTFYHGGTAGEEWERFGVSLFNLVVAALLATLLFSLAGDLTGDVTAAVLTAVLYGAGTIAWVHSKPFFSETLATLCVFSAFSLLVRARLFDRPRWVSLAGVAAGYALLVRLDSLFAFPALAVLVLWPDAPPGEVSLPAGGNGRRARRSAIARFLYDILGSRATWERVGRFAPPVILGGLVILGLNWMRYGSPFATGYEDQPEGVAFVNPLAVGLYGFLFSIGKGLFFFSPPLILFFFSIRRFIRLAPPAGWACVVLVGGLLLIHAKWINWAGGWCWGPRHIFMAHVFLALPICALLTAPRPRAVRLAYGVLLAAGIGVQLYGTSQNFIDYYRLCYRVPDYPPTAHALYKPDEDGPMESLYSIEKSHPYLRGERRTIRRWDLVAPIGDSIWRFQNSPWGKYAEMWSLGYHDYFWLQALGRRSRSQAAREWITEWQERMIATERLKREGANADERTPTPDSQP